MAEGLTQPERLTVTRSLHQGMNNRQRPWVLDEFTAVELVNLDVDQVGARKKRLGVTSIGGLDTGALGLGKTFDHLLDQELIIAGYGAGTQARADLWLVTTSGSFQQVACGVSLPDTKFQFEEGKWNLNGTSVKAVFACTAMRDSSDFSLAALLTVVDYDRVASYNASVSPTVMTWWQNRLWIADNKNGLDDETLWWSQLGDGLTFSVGNTLLIDPGKGGRITGIMPARSDVPTLLIFKEDSISAFEVFWGSSSALLPGPSDALDVIQSSVRPVVSDAGCVATRSIANVAGAEEGDIWFLSRDGVRAVSRGDDDTIATTTVPISDPIKDTIDRINLSWVHLAKSAVHNGRYYLAVPLDGATRNTHVLVRDIITKAWWIYDWSANDFLSARLNEDEVNLYMQYNQLATDTVPGSEPAELRHIYRCFSGQRDPSNSPIQWSETSRAFVFEDPTVLKRFSWGALAVLNSQETAIIDIEYAVNNGTFATHSDSPLFFPPAPRDAVIMGETPLPWTTQDPEVTVRKFGLMDVRGGYWMQLKLSGSSDFGLPEIVQTQLAARLEDPIFDNDVT